MHGSTFQLWDKKSKPSVNHYTSTPNLSHYVIVLCGSQTKSYATGGNDKALQGVCIRNYNCCFKKSHLTLLVVLEKWHFRSWGSYLALSLVSSAKNSKTERKEAVTVTICEVSFPRFLMICVVDWFRVRLLRLLVVYKSQTESRERSSLSPFICNGSNPGC